MSKISTLKAGPGGVYNEEVRDMLNHLAREHSDSTKSSFKSLDEMNYYYGDIGKFKDLKTGDNNAVSIDEIIFHYRWSGADNPVAYDPALFIRSEIGTTAGSLIMGPTSLESSAGALLFKDAYGESNYLTQSKNTELGSEPPEYIETAAVIVIDLGNVRDQTLTGVMKSTSIISNEQVSNAFQCLPASTGVLSYKTWVGTESDHQDRPVISEKMSITQQMVDDAIQGNYTKFDIRNPIIVPPGESLYSETYGVDLFGGEQIIGPQVGQTVPAIKLHSQGIERRDLALADEYAKDGKVKVSSADSTPGYLSEKIYGGSNITVTTSTTGTNRGLTISTPSLNIPGWAQFTQYKIGDMIQVGKVIWIANIDNKGYYPNSTANASYSYWYTNNQLYSKKFYFGDSTTTIHQVYFAHPSGIYTNYTPQITLSKPSGDSFSISVVEGQTNSNGFVVEIQRNDGPSWGNSLEVYATILPSV